MMGLALHDLDQAAASSGRRVATDDELAYYLRILDQLKAADQPARRVATDDELAYYLRILDHLKAAAADQGGGRG